MRFTKLQVILFTLLSAVVAVLCYIRIELTPQSVVDSVKTLQLSNLALSKQVDGLVQEVQGLQTTVSLIRNFQIDEIKRVDSLSQYTNLWVETEQRYSDMTNKFNLVMERIAVYYQKQENRIRQVEWNDSLDRCLRESLFFDIEKGRVKDVYFDGGHFAREYFHTFPGAPNYTRLRISDMSPKHGFVVKGPEDSPSNTK